MYTLSSNCIYQEKKEKKRIIKLIVNRGRDKKKIQADKSERDHSDGMYESHPVSYHM
jgi:hypothetical protein